MANKTLGYFKSQITTSKELKKREKDILLLRLSKVKLNKIGRRYKISAERVRQIEGVALTKLIRKTMQLLLFD